MNDTLNDEIAPSKYDIDQREAIIDLMQHFAAMDEGDRLLFVRSILRNHPIDLLPDACELADLISDARQFRSALNRQ